MPNNQHWKKSQFTCSKAAADSKFKKELYKKYKIETSESKSETAMYG